MLGPVPSESSQPKVRTPTVVKREMEQEEKEKEQWQIWEREEQERMQRMEVDDREVITLDIPCVLDDLNTKTNIPSK